MPSSSRTINAHQRCLLSNGSYSVMLSASGSGYSRWRELAVSRWREDPTGESWGSYLLLRDEDNAAVWSATQQPYGTRTPDDVVVFGTGRASFGRRHHSVHSMLEIAVADDADIELRRLTLSNHGDRTRTLSLTSYAEMVLGPIAADNAHPAFSKMFVQTEWDAAKGLLLATRRRRDSKEAEVWVTQALQIEGQDNAAAAAYETDRARFLGRARTLRDAVAMQGDTSLSNTVGCVLDPVFSLRQHFVLAPGASVTLLLWTQIADTRAAAEALANRLHVANAATRLFDDAVSHAEAEQRRLAVDAAQATRFADWMSAVLCNDPDQRAEPAALIRGRGGPPTLWAAGISGDRPIVLLRVDTTDMLPLVEDVLLAQIDWRSRQLAVDVVLLNVASGAATHALQAAIEPLASAHQARLKAEDQAPKAELFLLRDDQIGAELRDGLLTAARLLPGGVPSTPIAADASDGVIVPPAIRATRPVDEAAATPDTDEFANGTGAFTQSGRAYRIDLDDVRSTPAPWVNVIANPAFGFLVSAEGGGYTWSLNSQQNPLTPWPNDPVSDAPHDVLYLRDEETGAVWSATALPIRVPRAAYSTIHGKGWTRFSNDVHGIDLELTQCVSTDDPVRLSRLRLCNRSSRTRTLSITGYVEWALGANGTTPAPHVVTSRDETTGALFARNRWRPDFGERVAFFDLSGLQHSISGDRAAFLGPLGTVGQPVALLDNKPLNGRLGAGMDPCGALQTRVELPPQTQIELVFLLGDADSEASARQLIETFRTTPMDSVLADVATQWNGLLDTVQVRTPERAMDILLNDWLLYQVLGCRLWARTAYYQSSGAYGFRDQLQDVMALCVSRPDLAREHLLRAAGRQFPEGDVQHWWLPPKGQGVRTKISDDRIWLAYVAMHYVRVTGDAASLDEMLPFLTGQPIPDGASDAFFQPGVSERQASIYGHCAIAIDTALTRGSHGLPLIGTGDWNDGMNAVGAQGRGESSWLGWFLLDTIASFAPHAEQRGETDRARRWRDYATALRNALEKAWDGQWYRRGYYDDGAPLGSHESDEYKIDTIAQSWSAMAGPTSREHAVQAMASVERMLIDYPDKLARLFTPPFDHSSENPGYIKGYPPGVRENGGQYTHGAIWSIFAWARLGDGERAGGLFDLLNPIHHGDNAEAAERYKVEPYVVCADVYSVAPHIGRGGWTWYTGSAAWLYRAGLEALLGFHLRGKQLCMDPCIPRAWPGFELRYRHRGQHVSTYTIAVENPNHTGHGVTTVELDGAACPVTVPINLIDDGQDHALRIVLG